MRGLKIVIAVAAVTFIAQGAFNQMILRRTQADNHYLVLRSVRSVEELARITRDLEDQRRLIDDHILEPDQAKMAAIEEALSTTVQDLHTAMDAYAPLIDFPDELDDWRKVRPQIELLQQDALRILGLSRQNRNEEARSELVLAQDDFDALRTSLNKLIFDNGAGAAESTRKMAGIEHIADIIQWTTRVLWLLGFLGLGLWALAQVAAYARLENRNRDLDAFAGRVAHDVKAAMTPLTLSAGLLRHASSDPRRLDELSGRIESSTRRVATLVESLLAFARGADKVVPGEVAGVLTELRAVSEEVAPLCQKLGVTVDVDVPADLAVSCDPGLLHVLLSNLVGNAVKFLDQCPERRVRVTARADKGQCVIGVEDTGPGIPRAALRHLFEPFFRVEGRHVPGLGIGLATVRRIAEARGGRVGVESIEGKGSLFQVWLPRAPAPPQPRMVPLEG